MPVFSYDYSVPTKGNGEVIDISSEIAEAVRSSELGEGIVNVFVPGATAGVTTIEYEPGLVEDISDMFEKIVPVQVEYKHNLRWQDGNGHSHIRASLLGPSLTVPFSDGRLQMGIWQQVILIDFDNKSRDRKFICKVIGE
ncbi:MAG: YjbQ family protein [Actinobacteria bacterium]|nr:YjbQ family protein [Actinomycetota bacterium]